MLKSAVDFMQKVDIKYKFFLMTGLIISVPMLIISGVCLFLGVSYSTFVPMHILFAVLSISFILLHVFNRRSKLRKLNTQFFDLIYKSKYPTFCTLERITQTFEFLTVQQVIEKLGLEKTAFLKKLAENRIVINDTQQTLREATKNNDEKILLMIDIATQMSFSKKTIKQ